MASKIQWTDETWSPVTGCTRVSEGCRNCYAEVATASPRLQQFPKYAGLALRVEGGARWTGEVRCHEDELSKPLHWRKPRMIFVNSMSDTFHEAVPFEFVDRIMAVAALCPQHTFQVLTKRPERMAEYCTLGAEPPTSMGQIWCDAQRRVREAVERTFYAEEPIGPMGGNGVNMWNGVWPLRNVWLGTSVENQETADERIMHLLGCPAAGRFLSVEPLLGNVALYTAGEHGEGGRDWLCPIASCRKGQPPIHPGIDWVIVGGESGPKARPCRVEWIRSIVRQCKAASVACFVKQLGANVWAEVCGRDGSVWPDGTMLDGCSECVEQIPGLRAITRFSLRDSHGGDPAEWPEDLRVREMPVGHQGGA